MSSNPKGNEVKNYYSFLNSTKQEVILLNHLHYDIDEIRLYLKEKKIEEQILEIILNYISDIKEKEKRVYVDERDKNKLVKLWYKQYMDFGKINGKLHYPNLIIFEFQLKEIESLKQRLSQFINKETEKVLDTLIKRIYNNEFKSFVKVILEYYKAFGVNIKTRRFPKEHKFGNFIDKKIQYQKKDRRPIVIFLTSLRAIILGGVYVYEIGKYFPFFMQDELIKKEIRKYLRKRIHIIIMQYFPHLLEKNTDRVLKAIPSEYKEVNRLLSLPIINFVLYKYINWDFMPEKSFYDGGAIYYNQRGKAYYSINLHPLGLFFSYFNREDFEIFIDQLIHHEFVHIQQYRFAEIYDRYLNNKKFAREHTKEFSFYKLFATKQWIKEEFPEGFSRMGIKNLWDYLHKIKGGHTEKFMEFMQRFRNCKKAMISRGRIQTLYASFYYKLWGKDFGKGYWFLCNPNKPLLK